MAPPEVRSATKFPASQPGVAGQCPVAGFILIVFWDDVKPGPDVRSVYGPGGTPVTILGVLDTPLEAKQRNILPKMRYCCSYKILNYDKLCSRFSFLHDSVFEMEFPLYSIYYVKMLKFESKLIFGHLF